MRGRERSDFSSMTRTEENVAAIITYAPDKSHPSVCPEHT